MGEKKRIKSFALQRETPCPLSRGLDPLFALLAIIMHSFVFLFLWLELERKCIVVHVCLRCADAACGRLFGYVRACLHPFLSDIPPFCIASDKIEYPFLPLMLRRKSINC